MAGVMTATITCPSCQHPSVETMPGDSCLFFYQCAACQVVIRPKPGDCCVFCSYSDKPCPLKAEDVGPPDD